MTESPHQTMYDAVCRPLHYGETGSATIEGVTFRCEMAEEGRVGFDACARWSALDPALAVFEFSPAVTRDEGRRMLVTTRMAQMLPLWLAYQHALPVSGRTLLSLADFHDGPGLSQCSDGQPGNHLIPDVEFILSRGYQAAARRSGDAAPWPERDPRAFWRGSTTGLFWRQPSWWNLPRVRACAVAESRPDLFDVGLSNIVQIEQHRPEIEASGYLRPPVPADRWADYRYQIDIDGNGNAWAGYVQRLLTGSPVLKAASPHGFRQWFYGRMEPWVHFVPVAADMSDLVETVEWLRSYETLARSIGAAGRDLALALDYEREMRWAVLTIARAMREAIGAGD